MSARVLAGISILSGLLGCRPVEPARSIVLVSIDTLRADHVGTYGYERDTTPFLDRLARESLVFERAFAPASWTLISHMTMLTGLHPQQHGILRGDLALAPGVPLLAERLQAAGYRTLGLYFEGWIHARHGFDRGFDVFRHHDDAEQARRHWREELQRLAPEQPFFLFLHLFDVHSDPFEPGDHPLYPSPEPFQELFLPGAAARLAPLGARRIWDSEDLSPEQVEALIALYDGGVRHVDARLAELYADLQQRGLLENTLVVVTADHGEALYQRGRVRGHGGFRQEGLHVPLLVRLPAGQRAGERVSSPVQLADLVPTLLDFAGLPRDARLPGLSLLQALPPQRPLLGLQADARYLLRWPEKLGQTPGGGFFRYDLERDPGEHAPQRVERQAFETLWNQALAGAPAFPEPQPIGALPEGSAEALRALGYAGEVDELEPDR